MTSLYLLERYPFWSADSAGWVKKAAYGFVYIPKPNIVPGEISYTLIGFGTRTNSPDHFVNQDDITKKYIREYIESIGVKFDDLFNKVYERSLANCIYLKNGQTTISLADKVIIKGHYFKVIRSSYVVPDVLLLYNKY